MGDDDLLEPDEGGDPDAGWPFEDEDEDAQDPPGPDRLGLTPPD